MGVSPTPGIGVNLFKNSVAGWTSGKRRCQMWGLCLVAFQHLNAVAAQPPALSKNIRIYVLLHHGTIFQQL